MFKGSDRNAHVSGVMDLSANLDTQWKDWQLGGIGGTRKLSGKDLGKPALPFLFFFGWGVLPKANDNISITQMDSSALVKGITCTSDKP